MSKYFDYLFIFLIGYQSYFIYFLFSSPAPNQLISLLIALIGITLWFFVWNNIHRQTQKHVTMAIVTGILSFSSFIIYIVLFGITALK
ncbi:hypothetical protein [Salipaludibacillus neizhouensis]|uniref:hypothetical protein n=1 Tax=Salipaludibacillus neizhouensis TaxID=885475 RepID=UPI000DA63F2D|nr:hypothetical protein [Salipaludibacillus neizhouensis]